MDEEEKKKIYYTIVGVATVIVIVFASIEIYEIIVEVTKDLESIDVVVLNNNGTPIDGVPIGFCGDENPDNVWYMAWYVGDTDIYGRLTITREMIEEQESYAYNSYYVGAIADGYVGEPYEHRESVSLSSKGTVTVSFTFVEYANWYEGLSARLGSYTAHWYNDDPCIVYEPLTGYPSLGLTTAYIYSTPEIILYNDGMATEGFGAYIDFSNDGSPCVLWTSYSLSIGTEISVLGESLRTGATWDTPLEATFYKSDTTPYGTYSLHICEVEHTDDGDLLSPVKTFDFGIIMWDQS